MDIKKIRQRVYRIAKVTIGEIKDENKHILESHPDASDCQRMSFYQSIERVFGLSMNNDEVQFMTTPRNCIDHISRRLMKQSEILTNLRSSYQPYI